MRMNLLFVAALCLTVGSGSQANADLIPLASNVQAHANPVANFDSESDSEQQAQGATLSPLNTSAMATAAGARPGFGGFATNTNYASASESFKDATSGVVQFGGVGWDVTAINSIGGVDAYAGAFYAFHVTENVTVSIAYMTSGFGSTLGQDFSPRFGISIYGYPFGYPPGNGVVYTNDIGEFQGIHIGDSGLVTVELTQPGDYGFLIACQGGYSGALPTDSADALGTFNFSVSSVPEPGSLALLGMGAVALIFSVRRRQKASRDELSR